MGGGGWGEVNKVGELINKLKIFLSTSCVHAYANTLSSLCFLTYMCVYFCVFITKNLYVLCP